MTLEQLKAEIKERLAQTNVNREEQASKVDVPDYFSGLFDGVANGFDQVLVMLDQLEPSWHEYPEEKPTEKNGYVVSVVDESNGYCFTDASFYHPNLDRFEIDDVYQLHVYAWAERPKPYKKEATK